MIYLQLMNNPKPIPTKYSSEDVTLETLNQLIEVYGINLLGLFNSEIEAFRQYLMAKEYNLDKININDLEWSD